MEREYKCISEIILKCNFTVPTMYTCNCKCFSVKFRIAYLRETDTINTHTLNSIQFNIVGQQAKEGSSCVVECGFTATKVCNGMPHYWTWSM